MRSIHKSVVLTTAVLTLGLGVAGTVPANAKDGDVVRRGNCSARADWKLKAKADNGRIEVEGEVDSNRNGQVWRWRILHNGHTSAAGRGVTRGPSGSFEVRRLLVDAPGTDTIGFRAIRPRTGEVCRGFVRF